MRSRRRSLGSGVIDVKTLSSAASPSFGERIREALGLKRRAASEASRESDSLSAWPSQEPSEADMIHMREISLANLSSLKLGMYSRPMSRDVARPRLVSLVAEAVGIGESEAEFVLERYDASQQIHSDDPSCFLYWVDCNALAELFEIEVSQAASLMRDAGAAFLYPYRFHHVAPELVERRRQGEDLLPDNYGNSRYRYRLEKYGLYDSAGKKIYKVGSSPLAKSLGGE